MKYLRARIPAAIFLVLPTLLVGPSGSAQEVTPRRSIDQIVNTSFEPTSAFILENSRKLRKFPALFMRLSEPGQFLLAAQVGEGIAPGETTTFTFFLKGVDGAFAATPVKSWSSVALDTNSSSTDTLASEADKLEAQLKGKRQQVAGMDRELRTLRAEASKIAGVDEIIDIKMDLARVKGFGEQGAAEQERLRRLIELGRAVKDPPEVSRLRGDLTLQLRDSAQKTALASRLTARKRAAGKATLEQRLQLVKEMSSYDPKALAQQVLKLRERRRALEERLSARSGEEEPD